MNSFFKFVGDYFSEKFSSLPVVITVLLIIGIIIMVITVILIIIALSKAAKKKAAAPKPPKDAASEFEKRKNKLPPLGGWATEYLAKRGYLQVSDLSMSFFKALEFLRSSLNTPNYKYRLPWYLLVGAEESGKTGMLEGSNLNLPVGVPKFDKQSDKPDCRWWFLNRGVILDIKGKFLMNARGTGADDKGWRSLLILLSRYRAARPLNGIILTISAEELYGKNKLSMEEINDRAAFLGHKLKAAQNSLGLRLPVYLVVTKTDVIPGFGSLCAEIPNANRQNILGWSSPYSSQIAFTSKWIEEAFSTIQSNLNRLRLEIFTSGRSEQTRDGLFVFPVEIAALKERLGIYINNIFKDGDYQEPLLFRGMYFVGDSGLDSLKNINFDDLNQNTGENNGEKSHDNDDLVHNLNNPDRRRVFFLDDLINEKILYEAGLARPLSGKILSINRGINAAKITTAAFAVIGTIGLYGAYEKFNEQRSHMMPVLQKMNALLYEMRNLKINQPGQSTLMFDSFARQLIEMMDSMDNATFFSPFVPASWFSPLRTDLNDTLKVAYQQIIVRTVYIDLLLKARELLNMRPNPQLDRSLSIAHLMNPTEGREFELVKHYIDRLATLDEMIFKFNNLRNAADAKDLDDLVSYTFNARLPQQFVEHYKAVRGLIENMPFPPIDLKPYEKMAKETLGILYQNYLKAMFDAGDPLSFPGRFNEFLRDLSNNRTQKAPNLNKFRKFSIELAEGRTGLGEAGNTWIDQDYFNPGKKYDDLFDKIDSHRLFGREVSQFLVDQTAIGFENLKRQLKAINEGLAFGKNQMPVGPMKLKQQEKEKLSVAISDLAVALTDLFSEPYMAEASQTKFTYQVPEGRMIRWDHNMVQMAYDMARSFDDFLGKHIEKFPKLLQENLRLLARESLQSNVVDLVARAQNFVSIPSAVSKTAQSEEILASMAAEMHQAGPRFIKLLELLNVGNVGFSFIELRNMLASSYFWLLEHVEKVQAGYNPFAVRDARFTWWDGKNNAAFSGFAVRDMQDLQSYMDIQRDHMRRLTNFAEPVVAFLGSTIMIEAQCGDKTMLNRWKRIVEQVRAAEKKVATSTYSALEQFILKDMNTLTAQDAPQKISLAEVKEQSGDFFLQTMRNLKRGMLARAEVLKRQNTINDYEELAGIFNTYIRGKFPFTPENVGPERGEVDPESLRRFYRRYDEMGGSPEKIMDQIYQLGSAAKEPMDFLERMKNIREFFEMYISGKADGDTPSYDFKIDFRTNRDRESGGNDIIDWYIKSGDDRRIDRNSSSKSGRWYYGSPLEIGFKFANSVGRPQANPSTKNYRADGTTATYKFNNRWALLSAIRQLNAKSITGSSTSYTLAFVIPTSSLKATVFNRVTVSIPASKSKGTGKVVTIPLFPTSAPELSQDVKKYADQAALADGLVEAAKYQPKAADQIQPVVSSETAVDNSFPITTGQQSSSEAVDISGSGESASGANAENANADGGSSGSDNNESNDSNSGGDNATSDNASTDGNAASNAADSGSAQNNTSNVTAGIENIGDKVEGVTDQITNINQQVNQQVDGIREQINKVTSDLKIPGLSGNQTSQAASGLASQASAEASVASAKSGGISGIVNRLTGG